MKKTNLFIFILLLMLALVGCNHKHQIASNWSYDGEYHYHICEKDCEELFDKEKHNFDEGTITKYPSSSEEGKKEYHCQICDYIKVETLPKDDHEHVYDQEVVNEKYLAKEATCTSLAEYYKSCQCGKASTDTFKTGSLLEHQYEETYSYDGTYHYHKAICCENITSPKEKHTGGKATCTSLAICSVCKQEYGTLAKHVYDQEVVDDKYLAKEATCSSLAEYYKSCACGKASEETFKTGSFLEHEYEEKYSYDETHHYYKAICCENITSEKEEHTYDDGITIKYPTVKETGLKTYTCTECERKYTEELEKLVDNGLVINGYNTQDATTNYEQYCGVFLYSSSETIGSSLYWHKVALVKVDNYYQVTEVATSGNKINSTYDYLLLSYSGDANEMYQTFIGYALEVNEKVTFDIDLSTLEKGSVNVTLNRYKDPTKFSVEYQMGFEHYNTKDELYEAFFGDYYDFLITQTSCDMSRFNIDSKEDFLVYCKTWNANGKSEMAGLGDAFGEYYLIYDRSGEGSFESQPTSGFIGYCYHNNMYLDLIEFLEVFFAYWRTDEGYTTSTNHGNDFFYSAWAAFVDTCKYFFFTSETLTTKYAWFTIERSPRVHYALDHTPGVINLDLKEEAKIGEEINLPYIERENYQFLGWYDQDNNLVTKVTKDSTVTPKFERIIYEVKFMNGGETIHSENVKSGLRIKFVPTTSKDNYEFIGWKLIDNSGYDYLNAVVEDLTFYAKWESKQNNLGDITINAFNTQDATDNYGQYEGIELFDSTITPGTSVYWLKIGIKKTTNNSYEIIEIVGSGSKLTMPYDYLILSYPNESTGSYDKLASIGVQVGDSISFSTRPDRLEKGEVSLIVSFTRTAEPIHSLILVDPLGTTFDYDAFFSEKTSYQLPVLHQSGYIFMGWYDNEQYEGESITEIKTNTTEDVILYAKWEERVFESPLDFVSDIVTSNTVDELPKQFNNQELVWTSSDPNLYVIDNETGYTQKKYQLHIKQTVTVSVTIKETNQTYSKQITINPVLFEEMTNPMAAYVAVGSLGSYLKNNQRYKENGTVFSDKFKANADMVYYAFAIPQSNGTVTLNTQYLDYLLELKNHGIRVLLVIDGANKAPLQAMVQLCNNDTTRKTFVDNIMKLVKQYNFDGVDVDWEFPGTSGLSGFTTEVDQINLNKLLRDLRNAMDSYQEAGGSPYILSAAIPGTSWGSVRFKFTGDANLGGINDYCDYVNLMSYDLNHTDYTTHLTSCYSSTMSHDYKFGCEYGANKFISLGLDKNKVILGCAGYGKAYKITGTVTNNSTPGLNLSGTLTQISGVTGSFASGTIYYSGIAEVMKTGKYQQYTEYNNGKIVGSYLYNATDKIFITYDSVEALKAKCELALKNGYGMMVWAYGEDATDTVVDTIADNLKK